MAAKVQNFVEDNGLFAEKNLCKTVFSVLLQTKTKLNRKKKLYYYEKNNKVHHVRSSYDYDDYDNSMFK